MGQNELADLDQFQQAVIAGACSAGGKGIEGTVTIEKGRFVQGNGINATFHYNFAGQRFSHESHYDSDREFNTESEGDSQTILRKIVDGSFEVSYLGRGNESNTLRFRIQTTPKFEFERASYSKSLGNREPTISLSWYN